MINLELNRLMVGREQKKNQENLLNFPKVYSHRKIHFHHNLPHCKVIDKNYVESIKNRVRANDSMWLNERANEQTNE